MNPKILVTGGNGYIGSYLVKRLVSAGVTPYLLLRSKDSNERIHSVITDCKILECDITSSSSVSSAVESISPQVILHLAGTGVYSYADESEENRNAVIDSNVKGTLNLLSAARNSNCETFVNTGSCFEYGSRKEAFKEDDECNPINFYGVAKLAATKLGSVYQQNYGMSVITVRPFTVYGPEEKQGRFISTMIKKALKGENLTLIKEKIVRDYIFIEDVVDGYMAILDKREDLSGETVNLSTGNGQSLEEVAMLIKQKSNALQVKIDFGSFPLRPGEVLSLIGDCEKAYRLLGWKAQIPLAEGIDRLVPLIQKELDS